MPQPVPHQTADTAIADQYGVTGKPGRFEHRFLLGRRLLDTGCGLGFAPAPQPFGKREHERVGENGDNGGTEDQVARIFRHQPEADTEIGEDEGEFAGLRKARAEKERGTEGVAEFAHDEIDRAAIADNHHRNHKRECHRFAQDDGRVEQHADRNEEQNREGIAERQRFFGRALTERRFTQDHAGEEGAERDRDAKQLGGSKRHPEGHRQNRKAEQFA